MKQIHKFKLDRVDIQVSLLTTVIVICSFLCMYLYNYKVTYNDMIYILQERSNSIYNLIEKNVNKETFYTVQYREDMSKDAYQEMKVQMEDIKVATGVRYIYTATMNDAGEYVYLVDGLDETSEDFRYPGDLIEEEVLPELERAMANEVILPSDIKSTSWGNIFVSYYPIHDNGKVVGVLGIEFPAQRQYGTYHSLRIVTPIIAMITCAIASILSIYFFRRLSNPMYSDFANSDFLTGAKNRNAFEVTIRNIEKKDTYKQYAVVVVDVNDLKDINDQHGHQVGDIYIKLCADALKANFVQAPVYRYGGDEFIILLTKVSREELSLKVQDLHAFIESYNTSKQVHLSISVGYAHYEEGKDTSISSIYERADSYMYMHKRDYKSQHKK